MLNLNNGKCCFLFLIYSVYIWVIIGSLYVQKVDISWSLKDCYLI